MNFTTPDKVSSTLNAAQSIEVLRGQNREKVNKLFDGFPPLSAQEAEKIGMRVNLNWLEGKVLEQAACRQYNTAFTRQNNYFRVNIPCAPPENQADWSLFVTREINKPLKKSKAFYQLIKAKSASVVRHGIGPQIWFDKHNPIPKFVAIEDLRVPTDTQTSLDGLVWFGVKKRYTPGELANQVYGDNADPGWNKPVVAKILDSYKDVNVGTVDYDWMTSPEKMLELYKQDMGYYMSDAVPTISVWHFYHIDETADGEDCWKLKIVPAEFGILGLEKDTFLFNSEDSKDGIFADGLEQLLHIQFGDLSGKPPFMYHAVRALGFLLMEPCFWMNLTRCRLLQHVWENFNILLRSSDPADRARSQSVELFDRGWIREGISIVPREQRHQIDPQLVEYVMSQMKQLMGESSSSYTQNTDTGTSREQTAFETGVKLNQVNSMMAGILNDVAIQETFAYYEIARRFCRVDSRHKLAMKFRMACINYGIPAQYLNPELWEITPDMPLGSGDQTLELAQATQLMSNRGAYSGQAQAEILHLFTAAVTNNPRLAQHLAPIGKDPGVNDAQRDAEFAFGTLMLGVPVRMKDGLNPIDQVETLLGLTAGVVQRIEKEPEAMATAGEVAGLSAALQYIQQLIQKLAEDPQQQQRVKQYSDAYGELSNQVKAFAQRLQQSQQAGEVPKMSINYKDAPPDIRRQMEQREGFVPSSDPEAQVTPQVVKAQQSLAINHAKAGQKLEHNRIAFEQQQAQKAEQTKADIEHKGLVAGVEVAHDAEQKRIDRETAKTNGDAGQTTAES